MNGWPDVVGAFSESESGTSPKYFLQNDIFKFCVRSQTSESSASVVVAFSYFLFSEAKYVKNENYEQNVMKLWLHVKNFMFSNNN